MPLMYRIPPLTSTPLGKSKDVSFFPNHSRIKSARDNFSSSIRLQKPHIAKKLLHEKDRLTSFSSPQILNSFSSSLLPHAVPFHLNSENFSWKCTSCDKKWKVSCYSALSKHNSGPKVSKIPIVSKALVPKCDDNAVLKKLNLAKSKDEVYEILNRIHNNSDSISTLNYSTFHFLLQQQKVAWKALSIFDWMTSNLIESKRIKSNLFESNQIESQQIESQQTESKIHESSSYVILFDLLIKNKQFEEIESIWKFVSLSRHFVLEPFVFDTLIQSCSENGRSDLAMRWLDATCQQGTLPSERALRALMKCLSWNKNLDDAVRVMEVSENAQFRNTESYNCLMRLYSHFGMREEANNLLIRMKRKNVSFDSLTISEAISVNGNGGDVEKAIHVFRNMRTEYGVKPSVITYTSLISVLGRNGHVQSAIDLFQEMKVKRVNADVATYNSMITLMGRQSRVEEAEILLEEMQKIGLKPNMRTFHAFIHMYGKEKKLIKISNVLNLMKDLSYQLDQGIIDIVLSICSHSANINDIKAILIEIKKFSNINSNYIRKKLMFYFKSAKYNEIYDMFHKHETKQNLEDNLKVKVRNKQIPNDKIHIPENDKFSDSENDKTMIEIVQELKKDDQWAEAISVFEKVNGQKSKIKKFKNQSLICSMIEVYGRQNMIASAEKLFFEMFDHGKPPDVKSFNTLMNVYAEKGMVKHCHQLFQKMTKFQRLPDTWTFTTMLKAYSKRGRENEKENENYNDYVNVNNNGCVEVYKQMMNSQCPLDEVAYNTIINVCGKYLPLLEIQNLFKEMTMKNMNANKITYNTIISLYVKSNRMMDAEELLNEAIEKGIADSVSYSTLINGYGKKRQLDRMEKLANGMISSHVTLSTSAFNAMIDAYGKSGFYKSMEHAFDRMMSSNLIPDLTTFNTIIHAYGDGGMLVEMEEAMEAMEEAGLVPNLWTFNILIGAYGNMGMPYASVKVLRDMQSVGLMPDAVTYGNLISAFEHAGDYLEAARWSLWRKQAGF